MKMNQKSNILFICSRNQWRSPTAERVWRTHPGYNTRSAGTSPNAKKTVSPQDISWADKIFVMEKKHKHRLMAKFAGLLKYKPIHVLDIPDVYSYMDSELIEELQRSIQEVIDS